jgi:hypothetical protein
MEKEYPEHRDKELEDCIHEAIESGVVVSQKRLNPEKPYRRKN